MENEEVKKNKKKVDVDDIKKLISDNKKIIIVSAVALLLVIIIFVVVKLLGNKGYINEEEKLKTRLTELAKDFYEVKYYPNLTNSKTGEVMSDDEKKEFAQKYKDTGITIDLNSLARLYGEEKDAILEEFKNGDNACNYDNTKIVIMPKEPFEKDSYEIKVTLDCGFEEKK